MSKLAIVNRKFYIILVLFSVPICILGQSVHCERNLLWVEDFNKGEIPSSDLWVLTEWKAMAKKNGITYNFSQKNGNLLIKLISNNSPKTYFLANMHTTKKYGMTYGKVEVKAKCPSSKGIWPGIWLRPVRRLNPKVAGEIDLMEWVSCFPKNRFQANFHLWGEFEGKKGNHSQSPKKYDAGGFDINKYHVYSAEWDSTQLIVKVDGTLVSIWYAKDYSIWPFDYPYELCLDLGYGDWGAACGYDTSELPQTMKVDWVKYYRLAE